MMSERDNICEQLSAYLDGELSEAEARRVEGALAGDDDLRAELDQLRQVRELVGSLPAARAPHGFVERVVGRAERGRLMPTGEQRREGGGALRWVRVLATAAVLAVAAGAGIVLVSTLVTTPPPSPQVGQREPEKVGEIARTTEREEGEGRPGREQPEARLAKDAREAAGPAPDEAAARALDLVGDDWPISKAGDAESYIYDKAAREKEFADTPGAPRAKAVGEGVEEARRPVPAPPEAETDFARRRGGYAVVAAPADRYNEVLASARNVDIYAADIVGANREVVEVLNNNGIVVEPPAADDRATTSQWASNYYRPRAAFANSLETEQVQIVAFVPKSDVPRLISQLQAVQACQGPAGVERLDLPRTEEADTRLRRESGGGGRPATTHGAKTELVQGAATTAPVGQFVTDVRDRAFEPAPPASRPAATQPAETIDVAGTTEQAVPATGPTDRAAMALEEQKQNRTERRRQRDLLRQQLQRQTALGAAGEITLANGAATRVAGKIARQQPTSVAVASAEVEPLLINVLGIRAAIRARVEARQAEQQQTTTPAEPAAENRSE